MSPSQIFAALAPGENVPSKVSDFEERSRTAAATRPRNGAGSSSAAGNSDAAVSIIDEMEKAHGLGQAQQALHGGRFSAQSFIDQVCSVHGYGGEICKINQNANSTTSCSNGPSIPVTSSIWSCASTS
jgi:hypothetical protein